MISVCGRVHMEIKYSCTRGTYLGHHHVGCNNAGDEVDNKLHDGDRLQVQSAVREDHLKVRQRDVEQALDADVAFAQILFQWSEVVLSLVVERGHDRAVDHDDILKGRLAQLRLGQQALGHVMCVAFSLTTPINNVPAPFIIFFACCFGYQP